MAVKHKKLAHPSRCQEVPENDIPRLLAQGWCELRPRLSEKALVQRQIRARYKEAGMRRFAAYVPEEVFEELVRLKRPGETFTQLLTRLILRNYDEET